jgi:hypothetical protein
MSVERDERIVINQSERLLYYKRRYKKLLSDLIYAIAAENECLEHEDFEPGSTLTTYSLEVIQLQQTIKALQELKK